MIHPEDSYEVILPDDFGEYAWEVEAKGVFWDVRLRYRGREFALTFYEPERLAQDIRAELDGSAAFCEQNLVVVEKVTKEHMESAVTELIGSGKAERLAPVVPDQG